MKESREEDKFQPTSRVKPHYKILGFLLALPFLPVAVVSFWLIRELDNMLYRLLDVNTSNALLLLIVYAFVKMFFGFWFGLIYLPRKLSFNSVIADIQLGLQAEWSKISKGMISTIFVGFFCGMGFLGLMDLLTIIAIQFLVKR